MTKIIYTDSQKSDAEKPSRFDVLQELNHRNALNEKLTSEYKRLQEGSHGEELVYDYVKQSGKSHWTLLRNVWLDYYGEFEIDLLLITDYAIYSFEVKHFSGVYEFQNNQCIRNGQKIGHNAISQAQKSFINLQNLFAQNGGHKIPIHGAVVFTGDDFDVKLHDKVDDLNVLMIHQLRDFIRKIARTERQRMHKYVNVEDILSLLNQHAVSTPFPPYPVTADIERRLTKGVICSHCKAPNIYSQKSYLECECGMYEPREHAIVRTICEYGMIYFERDLVTSDVYDFFGGELSKRSVFLYLNQYFKRFGERRGTKYMNYRQSFWKVYNTFGFKRSRYYRC